MRPNRRGRPRQASGEISVVGGALDLVDLCGLDILSEALKLWVDVGPYFSAMSWMLKMDVVGLGNDEHAPIPQAMTCVCFRYSKKPE
ncbi:MAG: hypothetical protein QOE30_1073 [Mycobacterium sp.]|nr:hypothetical protein [Mycobacterium sp.]